jgi:hypothetical protein
VTGKVVVAEVVLAAPEDPAALAARVRAFCRERLAAHKVPALVEVAATADLGGGRLKKMRARE